MCLYRLSSRTILRYDLWPSLFICQFTHRPSSPSHECHNPEAVHRSALLDFQAQPPLRHVSFHWPIKLLNFSRCLIA